MKHEEGKLKGVRGSDIYYQSWHPETDSKALLLIVHGLAEHCGRYMNIVNHFIPSGYSVYGLDQLGHGKSEGKRTYVERFEDFTDSLDHYLDIINESEPGKPIFLVGHSMGGLIGTIFVLDHQDDLAGAVISAPTVKISDNISRFTILAGKVFSALFPKLGLMQLDAEGVSRDRTVVQAYINDPLVYRGKMTSRLAAELLKAMQRVPSEAKRITLPIMIVQGAADRLVDPDGARMLYDLIGSSDRTIKIYDGLYHEVFNEPEHNQVLDDVKEWMERRLEGLAGFEDASADV